MQKQQCARHAAIAAQPLKQIQDGIQCICRTASAADTLFFLRWHLRAAMAQAEPLPRGRPKTRRTTKEKTQGPAPHGPRADMAQAARYSHVAPLRLGGRHKNGQNHGAHTGGQHPHGGQSPNGGKTATQSDMGAYLLGESPGDANGRGGT
jgi:hypothetical protein